MFRSVRTSGTKLWVHHHIAVCHSLWGSCINTQDQGLAFLPPTHGQARARIKACATWQCQPLKPPYWSIWRRSCKCSPAARAQAMHQKSWWATRRAWPVTEPYRALTGRTSPALQATRRHGCFNSIALECF